MEYTSELGRSMVTKRTLLTLVEEKLSSLYVMRAPRAETTPALRVDEAMVFVTFFDAGLRIPTVDLVAGVMRLYGVELAQLTLNSIVWLSVWEWMMRVAGTEGSVPLFAYLHDTRFQSKRKKSSDAVVNFGSVNLQSKALRLQYVPATRLVIGGSRSGHRGGSTKLRPQAMACTPLGDPSASLLRRRSI